MIFEITSAPNLFPQSFLSLRSSPVNCEATLGEALCSPPQKAESYENKKNQNQLVRTKLREGKRANSCVFLRPHLYSFCARHACMQAPVFLFSRQLHVRTHTHTNFSKERNPTGIKGLKLSPHIFQ